MRFKAVAVLLSACLPIAASHALASGEAVAPKAPTQRSCRDIAERDITKVYDRHAMDLFVEQVVRDQFAVNGEAYWACTLDFLEASDKNVSILKIPAGKTGRSMDTYRIKFVSYNYWARLTPAPGGNQGIFTSILLKGDNNVALHTRQRNAETGHVTNMYMKWLNLQ